MPADPAPSPSTSPVVAEDGTGRHLPVIDVTDPRFAVPDDEAGLAALFAAMARSQARLRRVPAFAMRLMMRLAARRSHLLRVFLDPGADYLGGLSTYLLKLGPDNLPAPLDTPQDRRIAAMPALTAMRLRLQQTAGLLADGVEGLLEAGADGPIRLVNIGGGPAMDSLNALILLRRRRPAWLDRPVSITVLDVDEAGPRFGAAALAALQSPGGALEGVGATLRHQPYDWNEPASLAALLRAFDAEDAIVAASSEGALFEYGSDAAIVANLSALGAGRRPVPVAGSVTSNAPARRRAIASAPFRIIPRGVEGFAPLAAQAGYRIARVAANPLSDQVLLLPA